MSTRDLLVEIGTEELPPKALLTLSQAFQSEMENRLYLAQLSFSDIEVYATPRRLALKILGLAETQKSSNIERFGPAVKAAFDEAGNPTKAALGFAQSCGVNIAALEQKNDGKVDKLFYSASKPGEATAKIVPDLITQSLAALPIPKRMRWGSSREEFVRPVHWLVLIFGKELLSAQILGLQSSTATYGHRFHHPKALSLKSADDYPAILLDKGMVEPSFEKRKKHIRALILEQAKAKNASAVIDEDLLDEVTGLVEWPVALSGFFDSAYLQVPKEALISSLKKHQKCFHLINDDDELLPYFITISNLESRDPQQVIKGNEKVIGPRLADAAFFFTQDKAHKLETHLPTLKRVIFQKELGSVYDKVERVKRLATYLAKQFNSDSKLCARAAELSKCDLLSNMVGEFADLQGVMGRYYAEHDNEAPEVCLAIQEHYLPRFAGDSLPDSDSGIVLALADRLDTIIGLFGIGQPPSGSKDPFALRRAALGVLRILLEKDLALDLQDCVAHAIKGFGDLSVQDDLQQQVLDFIYERLRAYYSEQNIDTKTFQAVDAVRSNVPLRFDRRIKAVSHFSRFKEAQSLAAANKRVANILAKLDRIPAAKINTALLSDPAEQALYKHLLTVIDQTTPLLKDDKFQESLSAMASLQKPLNDFFDTVMVNTDNDPVRENRQALLNQVRTLFLQIADISYLQAT